MARILIADDEESLVAVLKYIIEGMGHSTLTASNGSDALNLAHKKKPDLIILDIGFPDMDGYVVCAKLKQDKNTEKIPILMCSGKDLVGDAEIGFKLGIVGYIIKPFENERIKRKIIEILEKEKA